jgi:hypothetical protein
MVAASRRPGQSRDVGAVFVVKDSAGQKLAYRSGSLVMFDAIRRASSVTPLQKLALWEATAAACLRSVAC